jgi:ribonuclease HI
LIGYFDGASRGNPGLAGAGACLVDEGRIVWECAEYLGTKTNNEAEYIALLKLLEEVKSRGLAEVDIRGDSKLVVCQVNRQWKINLPHLRELAAKAWDMMDGTNARIEWVPRGENSLADALSNKAIDKKIGEGSQGGSRS